jgi:autotransporter-associated beta strand protein
MSTLGAVTLQKNGAGTLRLTANNTYNGTAVVNEGVLRVDGFQISDVQVNTALHRWRKWKERDNEPAKLSGAIAIYRRSQPARTKWLGLRMRTNSFQCSLLCS